MSHANISVFVPHLGCPNRCSFCDQVTISGAQKQPTKDDIDDAVATAMKSPKYDAHNTELAFFGGSFTAINRDYMSELLKAAYSHVEVGNISGIRISTRPDCIDRKVLNILKQYGCTAIELGAQSMCDDVLLANDRGHTADAVRKASSLIKENGFELGLQMMTGLYKSTVEKDILTATEIIKLKPETVRIYPSITLKNTRLAKLFQMDEYTPPTLEETVKLCAKLKVMFEQSNIKIIRMGLHTIDEDNYIAGPWHPAFSELCDSRIFYCKIVDKLTVKGEYKLFVNPKDISKAVGNKRSNIEKLNSLGYKCTVIQDDSIAVSKIRVERMNNSCF